LCTVLGVPACTPEPRPDWLIDAPRSLGLVQEVTQRGPYGTDTPSPSRTMVDTLPGDAFRLIPLIADATGPIPPEALDFAWYLCGTEGCAYDSTELLNAPACPPERPYNLAGKCWLGRGPALETSLAPPAFAGAPVELGAVALAPTVLAVGGAKRHASPEECGARFLEARDLESCIFMLRSVHLGPVKDLVAIARTMGVEVEVSESQAPLLAETRNHNPAALFFEAEPAPTGHIDGSFSPDESLSWPPGTEVELRYTPDEEFDLEPTWMDGRIVGADTLSGSWFATHPDADLMIQRASDPLTVSFTVPYGDDPWSLVFVVRDDTGGEAWATLTIHARPG